MSTIYVQIDSSIEFSTKAKERLRELVRMTVIQNTALFTFPVFHSETEMTIFEHPTHKSNKNDVIALLQSNGIQVSRGRYRDCPFTVD